MVKSNRPDTRKSLHLSTDAQISLLIAAVTLGLLLRDVVGDLLPGDAGEFHFAAWRWGLAHPTGYPLYLLLGGLWQRIWGAVGLSPALSLNALSAVFTAAAAAAFYLLLRRWLPGPLLSARLASGLGVAFLVVNPTLRTQSIQAEVYSLHLLLLILILLSATRLASPPHPADHMSDTLSPRRPQVGHPLTPPTTGRTPFHPLIPLALLIGLSLAHHAGTLLLLPPLLVYLFLARPGWWKPLRACLWAGPALLLPLLLYAYIPLRSGPDASPWYHQRLGEGVLLLYAGGRQAFIDFVTGRSISVGFVGAGEAWANLPTAAVLWLRHFEWTGLLLIVLGLVVLVRLRQWPLLALTLGYALLHQVFNLFYAIGDIFVYYIPLYLVGCIWLALGAAGIGSAFRFAEGADQPAGSDPSAAPPPANRQTHAWSAALLVIFFWFPLQLWVQYSPLLPQLQAESAAARGMWEEIMAAEPPDDALLVSNDRNEIVPLFFLQTIEGRGVGMSGLFPLIAPVPAFADLGETVQTALDQGGDQPVYLIKPMAGLEARFALAPATEPLVEVLGPAAIKAPAQVVNAEYGSLLLLGYDMVQDEESTEVTLHWQVVAAAAADYTTTVQLFDAAGEKIAQDDLRAGGAYYPTSLWKPGEVLLDRHRLLLPAGAEPARMLIAMYSGPEATLLAPPLEIAIGP